jgi:DNA-binding NarL/FixJ family response regulator
VGVQWFVDTDATPKASLTRSSRPKSMSGAVAVAARLAQGWTASEIDEARGVMVGTLHQQVKSLMATLGCRRQTDVVALFHSFPELRIHEPGQA